MALVVGHESHLDHGITVAMLMYVLNKFKNKRGFFIETITLPRNLGEVPCGLYGPAMGDSPIPRGEVRMAKRPGRRGPTPMIDLPPRLTRKLTVIAGPEAEFDPFWGVTPVAGEEKGRSGGHAGDGIS